MASAHGPGRAALPLAPALVGRDAGGACRLSRLERAGDAPARHGQSRRRHDPPARGAATTGRAPQRCRHLLSPPSAVWAEASSGSHATSDANHSGRALRSSWSACSAPRRRHLPPADLRVLLLPSHTCRRAGSQAAAARGGVWHGSRRGGAVAAARISGGGAGAWWRRQRAASACPAFLACPPTPPPTPARVRMLLRSPRPQVAVEGYSAGDVNFGLLEGRW